MATETGDPFDMHGRYENTVERLQNSGYGEENLEILMQFQADLYQGDGSLDRAENILSKFRQLGKHGHVNFNFEEASVQELKKLVGKINRNNLKSKNLKSETLRDYKKAISRLYSYLGEEEKIEWMSVSAKKSDRSYVDPADLPTVETVRKLCKGYRNSRDRAFIHLLHETGMRPIEIFNLKWKHVSEREGLPCVQIHRSKTFRRTVPFRRSESFLEEWREDHPSGSGDSFVFTPLKEDKMAGYYTLYRATQRAFSRVETEQRVNFKAFRKSRATSLASEGFNVFQLMQFFGWELPETALYYVRLAENDLFRAYKENLLKQDSKRCDRDRVRRRSTPALQASLN